MLPVKRTTKYCNNIFIKLWISRHRRSTKMGYQIYRGRMSCFIEINMDVRLWYDKFLNEKAFMELAIAYLMRNVILAGIRTYDLQVSNQSMRQITKARCWVTVSVSSLETNISHVLCLSRWMKEHPSLQNKLMLSRQRSAIHPKIVSIRWLHHKVLFLSFISILIQLLNSTKS